VNQTEGSVPADVGGSQYTLFRRNRHLKILNKLGSDVIATRSYQAFYFVVYAKSKTILSYGSSLFSNVTQHGLVVNYRRLGTANRSQIQGSGSVILLGVLEP
jgi:hypothetical protein